MDKSRAIELLGGSVTSAAAAVGVTASAITQWPEQLPKRLEDRVLAALARKHLPPDMLTPPTPAQDTKAAARSTTQAEIDPYVCGATARPGAKRVPGDRPDNHREGR